jgi:hypothetical protein
VVGSGSSGDEEEWDVETDEDTLRELEIASRGLCPECGGTLIDFKDDLGCGKRCARCGWSASTFGSCRDMTVEEFTAVSRAIRGKR